MLYKLIQRGQWTARKMEKRSTMEELMEVLSALKPEIDFTKETELIDEGLLESFDVDHTDRRAGGSVWCGDPGRGDRTGEL